MASFTDQIPQFNPYVQQLPVEAMTQVGMMKQAQYDQGIQTIQAKVDSVAGLDVINDVDKKYLRAKLSNLQTDLRKVAAGDFSNFQLVNKVGGMVGSIARDTNVQNAVKSTAIYREQEATIVADREEGIENPNNTNKFYKDAQSWLKATEPGQVLQARYFKPINVWDKINAIAEEVGVDESVVQELYQTDEAGNRLYETDKNGNKTPIWNPIMVERHLKGKDAGKILRAFQSGLNAADYRQLSIDGEMSKANDTPEMLEGEIRSKSLMQLKKIEHNVVELEIALHNENQKNKKDEAAIASISNQLEYFKEFKGKLESSIDKNIKAAYSNPDAVRASLYTNDYLFDMSNALSSQEERINYSVSPMHEVTMSHNKFQLEQEKFKRLQIRDMILDDQWQKNYDLEAWIAQQKNRPSSGTTGTPISLDVDKNSLHIVGDVEGEFSNTLAGFNDTAYKIALEYYKEINPDLNDDEVKRKLYNDSNEVDSSINPNSGDRNQFVQQIASKQIETWNTSPDGIPMEFQSAVKQVNELNKSLDYQKGQIEDVEKVALATLADKGIDAKSINDFKETIKPFTINLKNGKEVEISKDDILDMANLQIPEYGLFDTSAEKELARQSKERLKLKYKENFDEIFERTVMLPRLSQGQLSIPELNRVSKFIKNSKLNELTKEKAKIYEERGAVQQGMAHPVEIGKEKEADVRARINTIVSKYKNNEIRGYNQEDMLKALFGEGGYSASVNVVPSGSTHKYILNLTGKGGKIEQVEIDKNDAAMLNIPEYANNYVPDWAKKLRYKDTTSRGERDNPKTTWFGHSDFTKLYNDKELGYTVTADYIKDRTDPNLAWLKLYIHEEGKTPYSIMFPGKGKPPLNLYNDDNTFNLGLNYIPSIMDATTIEALKKSN